MHGISTHSIHVYSHIILSISKLAVSYFTLDKHFVIIMHKLFNTHTKSVINNKIT